MTELLIAVMFVMLALQDFGFMYQRSEFGWWELGFATFFALCGLCKLFYFKDHDHDHT